MFDIEFDVLSGYRLEIGVEQRFPNMIRFKPDNGKTTKTAFLFRQKQDNITTTYPLVLFEVAVQT